MQSAATSLARFRSGFSPEICLTVLNRDEGTTMPHDKRKRRAPLTPMLAMTLAVGTSLGTASCDFSRPAGTSAWDGGSSWYGSAQAPAPATAPQMVEVAPPPPPAHPSVADAHRPPPPRPVPVQDLTIAPAVRPATSPAEDREPVRIGPPDSVTAPSAIAAPVVLPTAPPAVLDPSRAAAVTTVLPQVRAIRMRGRLYRSFGELGRVEIADGLRLQATGTGTPTAWCAALGTPRLTIVTAQGVCFYDRNGDQLLDTMAIVGRPELGYMELGPFPYANAD